MKCCAFTYLFVEKPREVVAFSLQFELHSYSRLLVSVLSVGQPRSDHLTNHPCPALEAHQPLITQILRFSHQLRLKRFKGLLENLRHPQIPLLASYPSNPTKNTKPFAVKSDTPLFLPLKSCTRPSLPAVSSPPSPPGYYLSPHPPSYSQRPPPWPCPTQLLLRRALYANPQRTTVTSAVRSAARMLAV